MFDNGLKLTVAQDEAVVIDALLHADRETVTLEGSEGRFVRINAQHVIAVESTDRPSAAH